MSEEPTWEASLGKRKKCTACVFGIWTCDFRQIWQAAALAASSIVCKLQRLAIHTKKVLISVFAHDNSYEYFDMRK